MNLTQFVKNNDKWLGEVTEEIGHVAKGLTVTALDYILKNSPQYSGDFVANWNFSINTPDDTFIQAKLVDTDKSWKGEVEPFKLGDYPAIAEARNRNRGKDKGYKLGDTFYLTNASFHNETYAVKIETGAIRFRPDNAGGEAPVRNALEVIGMAYSRISKAEAKKLIGQKL